MVYNTYKKFSRIGMKFQKLSMCFAVSLSLSAPAFAADKALLAQAGKMAKICSDNMPDSQKAKDAFKSAGFRYEGFLWNHHVYSYKGRRIFGSTTVTSSSHQACVIAVSKMTVKEAVGLIQPWVKLAKAKRVKPKNTRKVAALWIGKLNGKPVQIAVRQPRNYSIMRGAAIEAVSFN